MSKKNEKKIEETEEFTNLENQLKRALADYQNLEKRIAEEKANWIRIANKDLLLKLLPGLDNLLLAQKHTQDEGVKISIKHFLDILEQEGVRKIETVGKDFDPNLMEAVGTVQGEENKVVEETRIGYMIFDQVLRPAQVIVGSAKQNEQ
jgi:molecular chaperone GrpE